MVHHEHSTTLKKSCRIYFGIPHAKFAVYLSLSAHCRRGYFFCPDTKEAKHQVSKEASFAAQGLCPLNRTDPRAAKSCRYFVRSSPRFGKYCYALPYAPPTIALPAFARSFFADGIRRNILSNSSILKIRVQTNALAIAADTSPEPNACRRMSG